MFLAIKSVTSQEPVNVKLSDLKEDTVNRMEGVYKDIST